MSGFCGGCGRPRIDGHAFCGGCGFRFPLPVQMCPTCGQPWSGESTNPSDAIAIEDASTRRQLELASDPGTSPDDLGKLSFSDNPDVLAAVLVNPNTPQWAINRAGARVQQANVPWGSSSMPGRSGSLGGSGAPALIGAVAGEPANAGSPTASVAPEAGSVSLPRGPDRGPEFDEEMDCGNCGFERPSGAVPCPRCGSVNTGPDFRPGA